MLSHDKEFTLFFKTRDKAILAKGQDFNYITDKNDTKLILVYFTRPENKFSKKASVLNEMKKVIFERMEQNNIGVIDIDDAIKESFPIPSVLYPKHHPGFHYNKLGYKFIGEKIVEFIDENG